MTVNESLKNINDRSAHLKLIDTNIGLIADGLGKYINKRRVVRNVSFGVQRGEAIGILGPMELVKQLLFICYADFFLQMRGAYSWMASR